MLLILIPALTPKSFNLIDLSKSNSCWNGIKSIGSKSLKEGNEFGPSFKTQWDSRRTDQLIGNCLKLEKQLSLFGQPTMSFWAQMLLSKRRHRSFKIQIQSTLISFQKAIHSRILFGEGNLNLDVTGSSVCIRTRIRKDSDIRHNESQSLMHFAINWMLWRRRNWKGWENFKSVCQLNFEDYKGLNQKSSESLIKVRCLKSQHCCNINHRYQLIQYLGTTRVWRYFCLLNMNKV